MATPEGAVPATRSETVDRYLETIWYIGHEGQVPRPGRIAEWLGVSAPTVSVTLQRLERDGWVAIARDRSVTLTDAGDAAAAGIVRRHRLLERWLVDVLGLDWATADREAEALAHGISDLVVERLDAHLGHPSTCPHGNEIPGRDGAPRRLVAVAELEVGAAATVRRISEVAEHDAPSFLGLLHRAGLVPGAAVTVIAAGDPMRLAVGEREITLDRAPAAAVWVEAAGRPGDAIADA